MKLFLSSVGIDSSQSKAFLDLTGKPPKDAKLAYIANAADPYPPEKRGWMNDVELSFKKLGYKPVKVDLKKYDNPALLHKALSGYDIIWCGGGNTWYLRYLMKTSGFDQVIRKLLSEDRIYAGDSAGAIVATPTLKYVDLLDDPEQAPEKIESGLNLVDFAIVPHWESEPYHKQLESMRNKLAADGYEVKCITDQQAIIVNGDKVTR